MVDHVTAGDAVAADLYAFGTPIFNADAATPRYRVQCTAQQWGRCGFEDKLVPIPIDARPSPGSDASMVVIDQVHRLVFDFWQARRTVDGSWVVSWGEANPLDGVGNENGGAIGAGFSALAGVVRATEIANGRIDHAMVFSTDNACRARFRYPATSTDGESTSSDCIPQGARVQLDPSVDVAAIPGITPAELTVAKALQTYGAYCRDSGGAPMAFIFENPIEGANPYPEAGLAWDYHHMPHIPWQKLRVLNTWTGR